MARANAAITAAGAVVALLGGSGSAIAQSPCRPDGSVVAAGWCLSIVARGVGPVRQLARHPSGWIIAALAVPPGMIRLRPAGDGLPAAAPVRFGPGIAASAVAWRQGWLYLASNSGVVRYHWPAGAPAPDTSGQWIVRRLPGDVQRHPALHLGLAVAGDGSVYLGIPAESNQCQVQDGLPHSPGRWPCDELWQRAGVWRLTPAADATMPWLIERYATGLRTSAALTIDSLTGRIWTVADGRSGLSHLWDWPDTASARQSAALLEQVVGGGDYGWPYCQGAWRPHATGLVPAPEYRDHDDLDCGLKSQPVLGFPGNWTVQAMAVLRRDPAASDQSGTLVLAVHATLRDGAAPEGDHLLVIPLDRNGRPVDDRAPLVTLLPGEVPTRLTGVAIDAAGGILFADGDRGIIYRLEPSRADSNAPRPEFR